jgi:septal ring factor EnvC (AmiA/AmiB activator)
MSRFRSARLAVCCVLAALPLSSTAADSVATKAELDKIRARIEHIRSGVAQDLARRDQLAADLRRTELAIQASERKLAAIRDQRRTAERELRQLREQHAALERRLQAERRSLAGELRSAYMNGRAERLKMLLAQEDPATLGRMLVYYRYFGLARAAHIAEVSTQLADLERLADDIDLRTRELAELESNQASEVARLDTARAERREAVAALENRIESRQEQLSRLEAQAQVLEKLLEELQRAARDFPMLAKQPFERTRGRLPWPVKGQVAARFGEPRAGGPLRWRGVLIAAPAGTDVRAPHYARVIYADWLPGMGLLLVLDHGDGYLSLYGHNERLYRAVGDQISPGDVIAAVGDAGGDARAGLYMEIRKGKTPLDPTKWLRKP